VRLAVGLDQSIVIFIEHLERRMTEQKVTVGISGTEMLELGVVFGHAAAGGQCTLHIGDESLLGKSPEGHAVTSDGWSDDRLDLHNLLKARFDEGGVSETSDGRHGTGGFQTVALAGKKLTIHGLAASVGGSSAVSMVVSLWCALEQEELEFVLVDGAGEAGTVEDVSKDADHPGEFVLEISFVRAAMVPDGPGFEDE
jgi:hypothetical protein